MKLAAIATGLLLLNQVLAFCQDTHSLLKRAASTGNFDAVSAISTNSDEDQQCLTDLDENVINWFLHFNAIALEGFVTGNSHQISGPLYVQGQFIAPTYSINGKSVVDCSDANNDVYSKIGLVINFSTGAYVNIALNGQAYLPSNSHATVLQQSDNCATFMNNNFGPVQFATMVAALNSIENALLAITPTLQIKMDGTLHDVGARSDPKFDKLQFSPCIYQTCHVAASTDSDNSVVLFNSNKWNGPVNRAYPNDTIIIFSIPVWENFFIYLNTDYISKGLQPCRAIFHFYPVSGDRNNPSTAVYNPDSQAELVRDTHDYLAGLTFAPKMVISDGDSGGFAGQLVARAYQWRNPSGGADILNYADTGDFCQGTFVCFPPTNYTRPPITTHSVTKRTTTTTPITTTLSTTFTVVLPTDTDTTTNPPSLSVSTITLTVTNTITEHFPGYYNTLHVTHDTTTTTATTTTVINTDTVILIENSDLESTKTVLQLDAATETETKTVTVTVLHPEMTTTTEYPTIYSTEYITETTTITEYPDGNHKSSDSESSSNSSSQSESDSNSSQSESDSNSSQSESNSSSSQSESGSSSSQSESNSSSSQSESGSSSSQSESNSSSSQSESGSSSSQSESNSSSSQSESGSTSSQSESDSRSSQSESNSSSSQSKSDSSSTQSESDSSSAQTESESESESIWECTESGNHNTHHHHHHHEDEKDCQDESHHHHHEDEEDCEDESHHHEYEKDDDEEEEEKEKEKEDQDWDNE